MGFQDIARTSRPRWGCPRAEVRAHACVEVEERRWRSRRAVEDEGGTQRKLDADPIATAVSVIGEKKGRALFQTKIKKLTVVE